MIPSPQNRIIPIATILTPVLVLSALPLLPLDAGSYLMQVSIFLFLNIVLAQSYDLMGGYLGYINLGHIVFFGLGAYAMGILYNLGLAPVSALPLAGAITAGFALLISYPIFRLRGPYFALGTFGLVKLMEQVTINLGWLTGGSNGLKIEPGDRTMQVYYLSLAVVILAVWCSWKLGSSGLGLVMESIREDEQAAEGLGVPAFRIKAQTLVLSSIFPALMGGLYTWHVNFIDPGQVYGLRIALTPVAMAMLGGSGLVAGPIIGAVFLYAAEELIWTNLEHLHGAMLGLVIVLVGLFMPGGLVRLAPVASLIEWLGFASSPETRME